MTDKYRYIPQANKGGTVYKDKDANIIPDPNLKPKEDKKGKSVTPKVSANEKK